MEKAEQKAMFCARQLLYVSSPTKSYLYFLPVDLPLLQLVSGSDAADLRNNLTQTRSFEFSDSTEIGGILIPFPPYKITLMEDVSIFS